MKFSEKSSGMCEKEVRAMKRLLCLSMALLLSICGVSYALSVVGSKHDMRTWLADETTTQVCVFCHAPHGGSGVAPLWNHTLSNATYTLYTGVDIQGQISQPQGVSRACLSCHDGTVAINSVYVLPRDGGVGTAGYAGRSLFMNPNDDGDITKGGSYIGTDLSKKNHPVSITYRPDLDPKLRQNQGNEVINGSVRLPLYGDVTPYTVECGSCHNVHDPANVPFLRVVNTNDQLCMTCHSQI